MKKKNYIKNVELDEIYKFVGCSFEIIYILKYSFKVLGSIFKTSIKNDTYIKLITFSY